VTESLSIREVRIPPRFIWASAVAAFVIVECMVIFAEVTRHSSKPWFFHFVYAPVMLSVPLSTGWPLYRDLSKRLETNNEIDMKNRVSSAIATLTLVSYLALSIAVFEFM
jgi:cation transport ATPase